MLSPIIFSHSYLPCLHFIYTQNKNRSERKKEKQLSCDQLYSMIIIIMCHKNKLSSIYCVYPVVTYNNLKDFQFFVAILYMYDHTLILRSYFRRTRSYTYNKRKKYILRNAYFKYAWESFLLAVVVHTLLYIIILQALSKSARNGQCLKKTK